MARGLTIAGGMLEAIGLAFVFIELAVIRSFEFGVPTPWARLGGRLRRLLGKTRTVSASVGLNWGVGSMSGRAKVRPGPLSDDATQAERIAWLEKYVDRLDQDVDELHTRIETTADEVTQAAQERERQLAEEMERRDEHRRQALRPSLRRQTIGGVCVFAGIVLGTVGNVW